MNTKFRCPKCDAPAANVAEGHDPFAVTGRMKLRVLAAQMTCANGHVWLESQGYRNGKPVGERGKDLVDPT